MTLLWYNKADTTVALKGHAKYIWYIQMGVPYSYRGITVINTWWPSRMQGPRHDKWGSPVIHMGFPDDYIWGRHLNIWRPPLINGGTPVRRIHFACPSEPPYGTPQLLYFPFHIPRMKCRKKHVLREYIIIQLKWTNACPHHKRSSTYISFQEMRIYLKKKVRARTNLARVPRRGPTHVLLEHTVTWKRLPYQWLLWGRIHQTRVTWSYQVFFEFDLN